MSDLRGVYQPGRLRVAALVLGVLLAGSLGVQPGRAAERDKPDNSLKWVPANAAFYTSMLRAGEQVEAIAKSRAWAKLKSLPLVQTAWEKVKEEWGEEGKLAPLYKVYQQPENQQLVALLGEMFSQEVFMYGSESWGGFTQLAQQVYYDAQLKPVLKRLQGKGGNLTQGQLQIQVALQTLAQNLEYVKSPDLIMGFKLGKTKRAQEQLKRLEKVVGTLLEHNAELKKRFKREKIAGQTFLTLHLDGKLIPWDQIPLKDFEENAGEFDGLVTRLTELKFTVSIGLRDNYLLVGMGPSTAPITNMGKGQLLADRPELKPLAKFADKKLTSIGYVSQAMNAKVSSFGKMIDGYAEMAKGFLAMAPLSDDQRQQIQKDIDDLVKDLKSFFPKPGAVMAFSFLNGRGHESYSYDWGKHPDRDASKSLPLLNHAGGTPLLVTVGRSKPSMAQYDMLVKWIKVANRYFEDFAVPRMKEQDREKYQEFAKAFHPLMKQADQVTRKLLLPALADGQSGVVLDAKLTSKQWHNKLPESAKPLPLLEPALIIGVSDASKLRKAFSEYRSIANKIIAKLHEIEPKVPEFEIPPPKTRKVKGGTLYYYPIPEESGLDKQIVPNAGLSEDVAVLSISKEHSERLLTDTPLKIKTGPLSKKDRHLSNATYFNWARTVDALSPWVDMGARAIAPRLMGLDTDDPNDMAKLEAILDQVRTVFDVMKVCRSYSSATYLEDEAWVTHSETVIRDLPAK